MSSPRDAELLEADARYYRERLALLKARLYRRGEGSSARLVELERGLEDAERRLRAYRRAQKQPGDSTHRRSPAR